MANEWFVKVMGVEVGPLSDSQLREMAAKRQLTPDNMVRKGPSSDWVPAARIRGLFPQVAVADSAGTKTSTRPTACSTRTAQTTRSAPAAPTFIEVSEPESSQIIACPDCRKGISRNAKSCPNCGHAFFRPSRVITIALSLILGSFGAHKFYLRKPGQGVVYLLFFWTYIPGVFGIVEGFRYLFMDEERFSSLYGPHQGEKAIFQAGTAHGKVSSESFAHFPQRKSIQKRHWIMGGIATLLVIGIIGNALEDRGTGSAGGSYRRTSGSPSLRTDTPAAINSELYDRMVDLAIAKDYSGLETLLAAGLTFQLPEDTQIRIIDLGFLTTEIKVENGPYAGRYLIVATENINR